MLELNFNYASNCKSSALLQLQHANIIWNKYFFSLPMKRCKKLRTTAELKVKTKSFLCRANFHANFLDCQLTF